MYKKLSIVITLLTITLTVFGQSPKKEIPKLGENPMFFIDSVLTAKKDFFQFNPKLIASMSILNGKDATDILGDKAQDGLVYLESIPFAKQRFERYFKNKSEDYRQLLLTKPADSSVQYILNNKLLVKDYEGNLSAIDDKIFESLKILSKEELITTYGNTEKIIGVEIRSKIPDNLHNGEKKF
jgi:hypothetical protein